VTMVEISLEPDELQGLHAITELEAAAGGQADLAATAAALVRTAIDDKLADLGLRWNPSSETIRRHVQLRGQRGAVSALLASDRARRYLVSGLAVAILVVLWGGYVQRWQWTGFSGNEQLWDWLRLLLLPVVVGTIPLWIHHPERLSHGRRLAQLIGAAAFGVLILTGYLVPLGWTGFRGNTLWDWLGLVLLPAAVACARFLPSMGRSLRPGHKACLAVISLAWVITIIGGYAWHWTWTGYQGNTLWDWLGLLLLPLLVPTILLPTVLSRISVNAPARQQSRQARPART
jgi:uncharacterized membrane protein